MPGVLDVRAQIAARADRVAVNCDDDVTAGRDPLAPECDLTASGTDSSLLGSIAGVYHKQAMLAGGQAKLLARSRSNL